MRKIIEFHIVSGHSIDELEIKVTECIEEGLEPYGNTFFDGSGVFQTMVKYD